MKYKYKIYKITGTSQCDWACPLFRKWVNKIYITKTLIELCEKCVEELEKIAPDFIMGIEANYE